ncbi:MAG: hypothetical protein F6K55_28490 [Moorea sp. SIO4A3]|nr:hypothetical protein [Moorena sp. SIO4A3]
MAHSKFAVSQAKREWGKPPLAALHRCQPSKARVGETTAVAHGGDPQDRTASPVPKLHRFYFPHTPHPVTPYPV